MPDADGESQAILETVALTVPDENGDPVGPLSLAVSPASLTLVLHPDVFVLQRIIGVLMGWRQPLAGALFWWGQRPPASYGALESAKFNLKVSLVRRDLQLLSGASLYENLRLFQRYNISRPRGELREQAQKLLFRFRLEDWAYDSLTQELPEKKRRLGLYALALIKEPRLVILERPRQFLDRDYPLALQILNEERAANGLSALALGRPQEDYERAAFDSVIDLSGAPPPLNLSKEPLSPF
ncbi:MAG: hypothetical protein LBO66_09940 [Deltaproteobacteria bacterium]|jgi:ABC-type ATPase involved in cell division|nr:hypothetical protein [Deltaproteobacteria bacterium]